MPISPRTRLVVRALTALGVVLALIAALVVVYGVTTVRRSFPQLEGLVTLTGLSAEVRVVRDRWGVPQIYADNADDLFRAQGYVHAQDRFWEMDFRRHVTSGRLSEIFGADQIETDSVIRTMGWRRVARRELALLEPRTRRWLDDYADGVNAYLQHHGGSEISLEYAVLGLRRDPDYVPEPWTAADSVSWLKAMAWDLRGNMQSEIQRSLLSRTLSRPQIDELFPPYPYGRHQPIVTQGGVVAGHWRDRPSPSGGARRASALPVLPTAGRASLGRLGDLLDRLPRTLGDVGVGGGVGSNSWVVSGSRTASGRPLLANDPHLAPSLPSIWYQVGLHCTKRTADCPFEVTGFSFSGLPGVVVGHNDRIAWGVTNLGPDVSDLYLEKIQGDRYLTPSGMRPLRTRTERIEVVGRSEPVTLTVRSTRHGPLLSDVSDDLRDVGRVAPVTGRARAPARGRGYAVALRWTALTPSRTADALFDIDLARSWPAFRAAASRFAVPAQNLVYADRSGAIGYQAPGRVPIRRHGDGRWPVPGWTHEYDWSGYLPYDAHPRMRNPATGYIVTANNAVTDARYPYLLGDDWAYGYRSQRIVDLLEAAERRHHKLGVDDLLRMQLDSRNTFSQRLVPYLLRIRLDPFDREAQELLQGWDGRQPAGSAAAAYYNAVWRALLRLTFDDDMPPGTRPDGGDRWFEVVRVLLRQPRNPLWDDSSTTPLRETRDFVLHEAMVDARAELTRLMSKDVSEWGWGRIHTLELRNQSLGTSGIGAVEALFNRGPYQLAGGSSVVDATSWNAQQGYTATQVPSMRMVVDLSDLDASQWVNLGGESGHAYDENYTDQTELWRDGGTLPMAWSTKAVAAAARHTLTLVPGEQSALGRALGRPG